MSIGPTLGVVTYHVAHLTHESHRAACGKSRHDIGASGEAATYRRERVTCQVCVEVGAAPPGSEGIHGGGEGEVVGVGDE